MRVPTGKKTGYVDQSKSQELSDSLSAGLDAYLMGTALTKKVSDAPKTGTTPDLKSKGTTTVTDQKEPQQVPQAPILTKPPASTPTPSPAPATTGTPRTPTLNNNFRLGSDTLTDPLLDLLKSAGIPV